MSEVSLDYLNYQGLSFIKATMPVINIDIKSEAKINHDPILST